MSACVLTAAFADTSFTADEWNVAFSAEGQSLRLSHRASGAEIVGELAFTGPDQATDAAAEAGRDWKIEDPRDGVARRLAIVDRDNAVQGYIAFQSNGAKVSFLVHHRLPLTYQGTLSYEGDIRYREDAFAASTLPTSDERVLQLASGDADSELNDTLFSAEKDEALQIRAANLRLTSGEKGFHAFECAGRITEHGEAVFSFNVERGYYGNRWVPNYRPVDHARGPRASVGRTGGHASPDEDPVEAQLGEKFLQPFCTNVLKVSRNRARSSGWADVLLQARGTMNQCFVHGIASWMDFGALCVSQKDLPREQARVEATVVSLPGRQVCVGDRLAELAPDRIRLLRQALPVCDVHPTALYPFFSALPVWNLHLRRPFGDWHVVALFNWDDDPAIVGFDWAEIGEPSDRAFACWEFWTESWQGVNLEHFEMQIPPRSVRLLALQPYSAHPQFLTSDRHMSQGGVELKDQRWAEDRLETTVEVVGGFPMTVRFLVPESFEFQKLEVSEGVDASTRIEAGGKVLAVTLSSPRTRDVSLRIRF